MQSLLFLEGVLLRYKIEKSKDILVNPKDY